MGRPKLDRVVFSVAPDPTTLVARLLGGEADFVEVLRGEQVGQVAKTPSLKLVPYGGLDYAFLQFNLRDPKHHDRPHPVLADRAVRQALHMALDRAAIVRNVYDDRGRVSEQYDAVDNRTTFAYDEVAHKTLVTDPRGFTDIYQYDAEARLTSETDPLAPSGTSRKFIAGEPMKPATTLLAGRS